MKINIKTSGIELTPAITGYVYEKLEYLNKHLVGVDAETIVADVEVGKTTHHHHKGEVFRAEINLSVNGVFYRTETIEEDLYAAIDKAKDAMALELERGKGKRETLLRRGGRFVKGLLRGWGNESDE